MKHILQISFILLLCFNASSQKRMYKTGLIVDDKIPSDIAVIAFDDFGFGEVLPDSVSLLEFAPYPGNQGNYATCVGWSYAYCATSILFAQKYNIKNRQVITALGMCPFSIYNPIKDDTDASCDEGTHMYLGARELSKHGTKRFHLNEIGCGESPANDSVYRIFKVDNIYAIWDTQQDLDQLDSIKILHTKKALAQKKPVVIGFKTTYSFCYDVRKEDGFWEKDELNLISTGGHAMTIIGYNDKKFGGAFLLQNSWGQNWGKDGYAWVSYEDYAKYTYNAYVVELEEGKTSVPLAKKGCEYGNCKDRYSRFRFENGDVYEGDVKNGAPEGSGIYQWVNGEVFTGTFKGGKKEGKGTYYFADGTVKTGYWIADTLDPNADYLDYTYGSIDDEGSMFTGYYKGDNWIFGSYYAGTSLSMNTYTGKFKEGKKDGFGLREFTNYLYIGEVENDVYAKAYAFIGTKNKRIYIYNSNGEGTGKVNNTVELAEKLNLFNENSADTLATLDKKQCTYGDCESGYGKYTYASGNMYEGYFTNGYRDGYGKYTTADGNVYEGIYRANQRNELGKITMKNGNLFIGQFDFGKKSGYGIYVSGDKKAVAGLWQNDAYVEWEEEVGFAGHDENQQVRDDLKKHESKTPKKKRHRAQRAPRYKF